MVDISKLSEMTEEKGDQGNSINIMDAIKGVTGLVKEFRGLKEEVMPKESKVSNVIEAKAIPLPMPTPAPKIIEPVKSEPIPEPKVVEKIVEKKMDKSDFSKYFDKAIGAAEMGIMVYGDLPASEFFEKVKADKTKILVMIEGLL